MKLHRVVIGIGGLLVAVALIIGLWPIGVLENVGFPMPHSPDNMPVVTSVWVDCGSPLLKSDPVFEGEHSHDAITWPYDDCARNRDHRRGPVKDLGLPGGALVAVGLLVVWVRGRRQIEPDLSGPTGHAAT
jgi:hypothetical protein